MNFLEYLVGKLKLCCEKGGKNIIISFKYQRQATVQGVLNDCEQKAAVTVALEMPGSAYVMLAFCLRLHLQCFNLHCSAM